MKNHLSQKSLSVYFNNTKIGTIALLSNNLTAFEYETEYLKNGISISPFYLPLKTGVFIAKQEPFDGLFGVFNDSLPDGWGKLLTDRILLKHKITLSEINILDRLSLISENGLGALSYEPNFKISTEKFNWNLKELASEVALVLKSDKKGNIEHLYKLGGSSGGARPKVFVTIDGKDWIVKFKSFSDPRNIGLIEYNYSIAAKNSGIEMTETKLFESKYFGTRRFDRDKNQKYHVHSASGLLYASYRLLSIDYLDLIKATLALTKNIEEAYKMYRIMVFNVLNCNKDDHAKNFSFILKNNQWKLSPAYDLVLSSGFNYQHTTTILGNGNPTKNEIFEVAKLSGLNSKQAISIFDEVNDNCKKLRKYTKKCNKNL